MTLATSRMRLRALADRLQHQAELIRCGGCNPRAEAFAGSLADDAFAIHWAIKRIAELEAQVQSFREADNAGE